MHQVLWRVCNQRPGGERWKRGRGTRHDLIGLETMRDAMIISLSHLPVGMSKL